METPTTTRSSAGDVDLPEDVVFGILLWLPVTSLLRFKLVCKSWRDVIKSPTFIYQHLRHKSRPHHLMSLKHHESRVDFTLLSGDKFQLFEELDLPGFSKPPCFAVHMVSCDGIICLYCHDIFSNEVDIHLLNPATKQLITLSQTPTPLPRKLRYTNVHVEIGFGFDARNRDYKVVKLLFHAFHCQLVNIQAEVYNLSTDSWGEMKSVNLPIEFITSNPGVPFKNGTYCWLGRKKCYCEIEDKEYMEHFVVSFDFSDEVFGVIPLPDVPSLGQDWTPQLAFIRDSVSCINSVDKTCTSLYEIWMLMEYGVKESWTKLYVTGPFSGTRTFKPEIPPQGPKVAGLSTKGEFLFLSSDQKLCIYDLLTQETTDLPIPRYPERTRLYEVVAYMESLISIQMGNRVHKDHNSSKSKSSSSSDGADTTDVPQAEENKGILLP